MKNEQGLKTRAVLKKTMQISIWEGSFVQIYLVLTYANSVFITKFAVLLNALPVQLALLTAIAQFSQIFQLLGYFLTQKKITLRKDTIIYAGIGRFLTIFLGGAILFENTRNGMWFLLALLLLSSSFFAISGNLWLAWISNLFPIRYRGRFFARRSQYLVVVSLIASFIFSLLTDFFEPGKNILAQKILNFLAHPSIFSEQNLTIFLGSLFIFASLLSLSSLVILNKQPERIRKTRSVNIKASLSKAFKDRNFCKLLLFSFWWMLAVGIGSPFWGPFMLKYLHMSLFEMQLYGSISAVISVITYRWWGNFIDRFGNKNGMKIAILLGGLNPFFWLLLRQGNYSLIWMEAALSGFMWTGASIITVNFVLSIAPRGEEQLYSGINAAVAGFGMMLTALLSGIMIGIPGKTGLDFLTSEQILFGFTGIARWTAIIPLLSIFEPRAVKTNLVFDYLNQAVKIKYLQLRTRLSRINR